MNGSDVGNALTEMVQVLAPQTDRDWQIRAGSLEWSCWQTAAHIAHDLLAYAGQLAARPDSAYLPYDLMVREATSPADVLEVVKASSGLLQLALAAANPGTRAWHYGPCDPTGFAAMGVAETLLHTHDITQGSVCRGSRRRTSARPSWIGCFPTRRPASPSRFCCGPPVAVNSTSGPR